MKNLLVAFLCSFLLVLVIAMGGGDWGQLRNGVLTIVQRDSTVRVDVDSLTFRISMLQRLLDSVKSTISGTYPPLDTLVRVRDGDDVPGFVDSAFITLPNSRKQIRYDLWYALANSLEREAFTTYANNGNDSSLLQFQTGYATLLTSYTTPGRVKVKLSYPSGAAQVSEHSLSDCPPIGGDSSYITARIRTVGTGAAARWLVLLKHAITSAPISPALTAGTEVYRQQLRTDNFPNTGTGSFTLKCAITFNRARTPW